ncbi:uncharacterized protein V1518DRAFT_414492 [Limtongia smithiae]|uniref:uncharacterized protein n=1 Tax=Limtongia smithiae TaxID=1125753 RepID=UPI0034CFE0BB
MSNASAQSPLLSMLSSIAAAGSETAIAEEITSKVLPLLQQRAPSATPTSSTSTTTTAGVTLLAERDVDDILYQVDTRVATAPWILALTTKFRNVQSSDAAEFWVLVNKLVDNFSAVQARMVADAFGLLVDLIVSTANHADTPSRSLRPLLKAALGFSDAHDTLSPAHAPFVAQSLKTRQYKHALTLLRHRVSVFDANFGVTHRDHLLYHYYGAQVFLGLKTHADEALEYLTTVVCAPTGGSGGVVGATGVAGGPVISAVQIEAFKKLVLVQLMVRGERTSRLPRVANEYVVQIARVFARPYDQLAVAYVGGDAKMLSRVWTQLSGLFSADGNYGLSVQVLIAFRKQRIARLRKTYTTVPLSFVAAQDVDITESGVGTQAFVLDMIAKNDLAATLSQKTRDGEVYLSFVETTLSGEDLEVLEQTIARIMALNSKIASVDREVGMSREFLVRHMIADGRGPGGRGGGGPGDLAELDAMELFGADGMDMRGNGAMLGPRRRRGGRGGSGGSMRRGGGAGRKENGSAGARARTQTATAAGAGEGERREGEEETEAEEVEIEIEVDEEDEEDDDDRMEM